MSYPVPISDHALVRFLERVYGINLDEVKAKILSVDDYKKIKHLKKFKIIRDGYSLILENGVVITILTKEMDGYIGLKKHEYLKVKHKNNIKRTKGQ